LPANKHEAVDKPGDLLLNQWLANGPAPIYIGFGSNGVAENLKMGEILKEILTRTSERILFCTGWALYADLPGHPNLFVTKYVNHDTVLPQCKIGIFHGGAGTLCAMLRNNLPVVIVSFYTDQPTWGKIIARKGLGVHIPAKKLSARKLIKAIEAVQGPAVKRNAAATGDCIRNENGLLQTINAIEAYFKQ